MNEFRGRHYLENRLEYYNENEGDDIRAFIKQNKAKTLEELLDILKRHKARNIENYDKEGLRSHEMEIVVIQIMIADELNLPTKGGVWYLVDMIEEFRQQTAGTLADLQEELKKLKRHKHLTFGSGYSEKPAY